MLAGAIAGVIAVCSLSAAVFAADYVYENFNWYLLTEKGRGGASVYMNARNKEYTHVAVNTSNRTPVSVRLWYDNFIGDDIECPLAQSLEYGVDRRAWWNGREEHNYYLTAETNATYMNVSGYFRNYHLLGDN